MAFRVRNDEARQKLEINGCVIQNNSRVLRLLFPACSTWNSIPVISLTVCTWGRAGGGRSRDHSASVFAVVRPKFPQQCGAAASWARQSFAPSAARNRPSKVAPRNCETNLVLDGTAAATLIFSCSLSSLNCARLSPSHRVQTIVRRESFAFTWPTPFHCTTSS